ncbi:MAG: glutamyl-tRNA reductase [Halobacteriota archaeon]|uniref:glutamyl-tRNA reductase n=1 Tax=Natronomonas sp. TaxID=2184060 RepID=UPI00397709BB
MTTGPETKVVAGVSVSHSHASVERIEAVAADPEQEVIRALLDEPGVTEAFVLQTCNRAEAYVVAETASVGQQALSTYLGDVDSSVARTLDHEASLRHLMSVACGLESLVLGEDQIIGQIREAYETARGVGAIGSTLDDAILKALHVGERARSETAINEGALSLGSAAVQFAESQHGLDAATALVIGAGEMATLAAKALDESVSRLVVANRTRSRAERLANRLETDTSTVGLDALSVAAADADLVVSATGSPEHVVGVEDLETVGETCVIDIAQPRDVAPDVESLEHVSVYDLDAIETVTDGTKLKRQAAAEAVESMIDDELDHLLSQYKRKRADQVIGAMYEGAERIKSRELRTAIARLESESDDGVSETEREILESMADALVGQLLSAPTQSLRDAAEKDDWSTIHTALRLFGPAFDLDPAAPPTAPDAIPEEMRERMPSRVIEQLTREY